MTRRSYWLLGAILALAGALRLIGLEGRGIQYDDAFSIFLSRQSLENIISGTASDTMPPLYYLLLHFWIGLGGEGLGWLRLLSVILNLGSLVFLFLLVQAVSDTSAGLWALFLAAISPLQVYHAQDLRMYALLALAQVGYGWFFVRILKQSNGSVHWVNWVGLAACAIVAMYAHNLAVFVLAVPDIYLIARRKWRLLAQLVVVQAVVGLLTLPWLVMIPGQVAKIQRAFWTPQPGIVEVMQSVLMVFTNLPLPEGWFWLAVALALSLLALLVGFLEGIRLYRQGKLPGILVALAFVPPILLFVASYLMRPVFVTRGFLASTLFFLGLVGIILDQRRRWLPAILILAGFIGGAAIGLPIHYTFDGFPRSPFSSAVSYLRTVVQPGEVVVHDNKLSFFPAHYYAPDLRQVFLADAAGSANDTYALASQQALSLFPEESIDKAVGNSRRVFFVVFETTIMEYQQAGFADHPQLAWLKKHFPLSSEQRFNDLLVYVFEGEGQ